MGVISVANDQDETTPHVITPTSETQFEKDLIQENINIIAAKDEAILASIELEGGIIETPIDISLPVFASVSQIDFILAEQSSFVDVWTNPLWQFPDGLTVRITARTHNRERLEEISNEIIFIIEQFYTVTLNLYDLRETSNDEIMISLVAPVSNLNIRQLFDDIFYPYGDTQYGNMVSIFSNLISNAPPVYAFGYSLQKLLGAVSRISRSAIVGVKDKIIKSDDLRTFNVSYTLGAKIKPNPSAYISKFGFRLPFYANFTNIFPQPDNIAPQVTGSFEWILKYFTTTKYGNFDALVSFYPFALSEFNFPRVLVTSSYSDQLLEESGTLNMTYTVQNLGTAPANDTTIFFPIPLELQLFKQEPPSVPVLSEDLQINEEFTSFINLEIDYGGLFHVNIPILDIRGWYDSTTSLTLAGWMDNTSFVLDPYTTVYCSNGISRDLYQAVISRIQPILDSVTILEILADPLYWEGVIKDELTSAVDEAYSVVFPAFYDNRTLFNFSSNDFTPIEGSYGWYLETVIPYLGINETQEVFWKIDDIPTSDDKFGAFSIFIEQSGGNEYAVFQTMESDYKNLMITLFSNINSAGRFLSVFDPSTQSFISLGSRFKYSDNNGIEYYGLTNGLNFQLGDDEAVLESTLINKESIYRVGDRLTFSLNISNVGTLSAYDIRVDIVNVKLNYLWLPTDVVRVKSFDIDQINEGELISREFSIRANSYIGLNTYVAILSFVSDKDQPPTEIVDPWSGTTIPWVFGGETRNIISSTLSFGILLPPLSLQNQFRPAFPLPEITVNSDYILTDNNQTISVEYEIVNDGLSPANVSVTQFIDQSQFTLVDVQCSYISGGTETPFVPITTTKMTFTQISYANVTLFPGDKLVISETFTDLPQNFTVPPLIVNYYSLYEIITTDFQSIETSSQGEIPDNESISLKLSPGNVTEQAQSIFLWSTFSPVIRISFPISDKYDEITFTDLPFLYPIISLGLISGVLVIAMIISRLRK